MFNTSTSWFALMDALVTVPLLLVLALCKDLWALRLGRCRKLLLIDLCVSASSSMPSYGSSNKLYRLQWRRHKAWGEGHITVFPEILSDNRHRNKAKARYFKTTPRLLTVGSSRSHFQHLLRVRHRAETRGHATSHNQEWRI